MEIPNMKPTDERKVIWEIPKSYKKRMKVPTRIIGTKKIIQQLDQAVFNQLTNVASLPGVQKAAYCMPDAHSGYGFPIGGVGAFDLEEGIISPGGIGFDINCGIRLVTTNLTLKEVKPKIQELINLLFQKVPSGVGGKGFIKLNKSQFEDLITNGTKWCLNNGYAWKEDLERTEDSGCIKGADPKAVSEKAISRGLNQVGTLGSGNHFLEIQTVNQIFNPEIAQQLGISKDQVTLMIHCGSRGFGHQIGTDYLRSFEAAMQKYNITVLDRELACAPFSSEEGKKYFGAMACAANMAFVNRQVIMHRVRECFSEIFKKSPEDLGMHLIYDVAHNVAKIEDHIINNKKTKLLVHRKGATRAFPPGHSELSPLHQKTGQPVIIGGSMETGSYLLVGTEGAMKETFGSTAHGAGRTMSRAQAKREVRGEKLQQDMKKRGIIVKTASMAGLAEEAGLAYKDINEVVKSCKEAGISEPICSFKPHANVKG